MNGEVNILIAGDLCLQDRTIDADLGTLIQYHAECIPYVKSVDYSVVNLECSVHNSSIYEPIRKAGVALKCSSKVVLLAKAIGFKACSLANNHFADYGEDGIRESMAILDNNEIDYFGAGFNRKEARSVFYKEIKGYKIAFINACEHEFTIATEVKSGCNPINPISLYYDIQEAKSQADYVILILHGGHEEYELPSPRMQETYRFLIDVGADVVVNHHQHCCSGYEIYNTKPIFYGLGNFSFDENEMRRSRWNEGCMLSLKLGKNIECKLIPYVQNDEQIGIQVMTGKRKRDFELYVANLNAIIADPMLLQESWFKMVAERRDEYMHPLQPYRYSRLIKLAKCHFLPTKFVSKLLPEYFTKERKLFWKSYIQCESHRDIVNELLKV